MKLSIIMPAYNVDQYLESSLESLAQQTIEDFEVVVVDDGSGDRTGEIAAAWTERDPRFKLFRTPNRGAAAARNLGLDQAAGDYVAFLDADDWVDVDMFRRLVAIAEAGAHDSVSCDLVFERPGASAPETSSCPPGSYSRSDIEATIFPGLISSGALTRDWPYRMVTKVFRRQHLVDHQIRFAEHLRAAQDFTFSVEAMYHATSFFYDKGFGGYHYRQNPMSRTNSGLVDAWANYRALDQELSRIVGDGQEFQSQLRLAELHGDLSSLTYLYRNIRWSDHGDARRVMVKHLSRIDRSVALSGLDWERLSAGKRLVVGLIRRRWWWPLHALLLARARVQSMQRDRLLKSMEQRA